MFVPLQILNYLKFIIRISQKMLSILRGLRNECVRGQTVASLYLNIQQLQILALLMNKHVEGIFGKAIDVILIFNKPAENNNILIMTNFAISVLLTLCILLGLIIQSVKEEPSKVSGFICNCFSLVTNIFRYVFLMPILCLNLSCFNQQEKSQLYIQIFAIFNLFFWIVIALSEIYTNWSNRFLQVDYCNRRQNSIIQFLLYLGFIICQILFNSTLGAIICIIMSIWSLINLMMVIQFQTIQNIITHYNLFHICIALILITVPQDQTNAYIFCFNTFIFIFIVNWILCQMVSKKLNESIKIWYLKKVQFMKPEFQFDLINQKYHNIDETGQDFGAASLVQKTNFDVASSENMLETDNKFMKAGDNQRNALNGIIILSRLFLCHQANNMYPKKINQQWQLLWQKFNLAIISHQIGCQNQKCRCKSKKRYNYKKNQHFWLLKDMQYIIAKIQNLSNNNSALKITKIYLNVELKRQPLKGYYEIMRMKKANLSVFDQIDVETLIIETRECFDKIFLENDVQNQNLSLMMVFEVERLVHQIQKQIKEGIDLTINFLDLFLQNTLKLSQIRKCSTQLLAMKQKIDNLLQMMVIKYPEIQQASALFLIFYQYLQNYKSREKQFRSLYHQKSMKRRRLQKNDINVINAEYGVIHIDLAGGDKGKIKNVTRKVCQLYENTRQDMVSFNIRDFMPTIFSIYHNRFLTNFIENGKIKILKNKQRVLFGKNKKKFVFPFNARLKTEHLFDDQFGASALISQHVTNSNFIILSKFGNISQITEDIYTSIFGETLRDQIEKIHKFNIFRMIPELLKIISEKQYEKWPGKIHESLLIYSNSPEILLQKFRDKKISENDNSKSFVSSFSKEDTRSRESSTSGPINFKLNNEFVSNLFKRFLSDLPISSVLADRIHYKVTPLKTSQFQLILLEIIDRTNITYPTIEIIDQYKPIIDHFSNSEDAQPVEKNFESTFEQYQAVERSTQKRQSGVYRQNKNQDSQNMQKILSHNFAIDNDQNHERGKGKQMQINGLGGMSQGSSITDQTQGQLRKQTLINGFNAKTISMHSNLIIFFGLSVVLILCMLSGLIGTVITNIQNLKNVEDEFQFFIKITTLFQFKLASLQINQFLRNQQLQLSPFAQNIQLELNMQFKEQIAKIPQLQGYLKQFFLEKISTHDIELEKYKQITFLELISRIQYIFNNYSAENMNFLLANYQIIHRAFEAAISKKIEIFQNELKAIQIDYYVIFSCYQLLIFIISISFLLIYRFCKRKQQKILDLLTSNSAKEVFKAKKKLTFIRNILKKTKITQCINQLSTYQYQLNFNELQFANEKYQRHPKLIFDAQQSSNKQFVCIIASIFFIILSGLSGFLVWSQINEIEIFNISTNALVKYHTIQQKAPVLLNIYLSNVNKLFLDQPIHQFSDNIYQEVNQHYFDFTDFLAGVSEFNQATNTTNRFFYSQQLCQLEGNFCNITQKQYSMLIQYHILELKNKLNFLGPNKLTNSGLNKDLITQWSTENKIPQLLTWFYHIYSYTKAKNINLRESLSQEASKTTMSIIIVSVITIPCYLIIMSFIMSKFKKGLYSIIEEAERIFIHFPFHVLTQNTYLHSYFTEKTKNNN